jgi:transglutaminase-like putative cysteine protease
MRYFLFISLLLLICACSPTTKKVTPEQIDTEVQAGNFTLATQLIDRYIAENTLSEDSVYEYYWQKDKMHRIVLDFNKDKASVLEYIRKYYPDVNEEMLSRWEQNNSLEYMMIDGEKRYFDRAAPNLFRLDKEAVARKAEVDSPSTGGKESTLQVHLPAVVDAVKKTGKTQAAPVSMEVTYKLTLRPNAVPEGEMVRCWLPYPREDHRRQSRVKLLSVNDSNYILSPASYAHRTLFMQKVAKKDEPLIFSLAFSFEVRPEWFNLEKQTIRPYDLNSDLYKTYTAERPPHIVFTDSIQAVSERIVGDETDTYRKVKKIFEWVDVHFPWAGAREYSTIANIPQYVLENGHGDCGQVTLLFMTLARYNGIPARWQSGFMLHPQSLNLHDWGEFYIEGIGWIPIDESFGINGFAGDDDVKYFYSNGMDAYRWIVNNDYSRDLFPAKIFTRSDDVDFQRGELEWRGGNIYYDKWDWDFDVTYN